MNDNINPELKERFEAIKANYNLADWDLPKPVRDIIDFCIEDAYQMDRDAQKDKLSAIKNALDSAITYKGACDEIERILTLPTPPQG